MCKSSVKEIFKSVNDLKWKIKANFNLKGKICCKKANLKSTPAQKYMQFINKWDIE